MVRRVTSPRFIGRQDDLAQLERALGDVRAGAATHLLVGGEAGVGKSRFVGEAAARAATAGFRVLAGGCLDLGEGGAPFAPFTGSLRAWVREVGRPEAIATAGVHAADLARLVPELQPRESAPSPERWAGARIHDALYELCLRLSARAPLLMVLEDFHWADTDTLGATQALLRALDHGPVSILVTYRTDDLHRRHPLVPWLAEVTRSVRPVRIDLAPFDADELRALITAVRGAEPTPGSLDSILRRSDGNPFFAEELLVAGEDGTGDRQGLSASLRELLGARLASVSDPARRLLGVMAAVGRPVDDELLTAIDPTPPAELRRDLRELLDAALIVPTPDGEGYAFRHALVQEAAYDELLPGERRSLHREIALRMEGRPSSDGEVPVAELARHWRAARDIPRALASSVRAGDEASEAYGFAQAALEYDHALELWGQLSDPEAVAGVDRIELLRRAAEAVHLASSDRRSIVLIREAIELSRTGSDDLRTGMLLERLGRMAWVVGDPVTALGSTEEALMVIPADPPTAVRARAVAGLGQLLMLTGRLEDAVIRCQEAIGIAQAVGAREAEAHALNTMGCSLASMGVSEPGLAALERSLVIAREIADADDIGRAYVNLTESLWLAGEPRRALERVLEGVDEAERLGIGSVYGFFIRMNGVAIASDTGDWHVAFRLLHDGSGRVPESRESERGRERYRLAREVLLQVISGGPDATQQWARAAELIETDDVFLTTGCPPHLAGIELAIGEGRPRDAIVLADEGCARNAIVPAQPMIVRICRLGARAAADLAATEGDEARPDVDHALERFRSQAVATVAAMREPGPALRRWMDAEHRAMEAETARAAGGDDPAMWDSVAALWDAVGYAYDALYARGRAAVAALAASQADGPMRLRDAAAAAAAMGARPLAAWLADIARRHGVRLADQQAGRSSPTIPERPYGLTPRELEVLRLVTDGRSNRLIADELGISENTAGVHVSNILGKLGVSSRTEAARVGFGLGLMDDATAH